jgi:transcriptional regulator with XRE-family HTH domain
MSTKSDTVLIKHPLLRLREILDWSRDKCAEETGLRPATIQNIERGAAPLPEEAAFAIEAATSCNAMELLESAAAWRKCYHDKKILFELAEGKEGSADILAPRTLGGSLFQKETYDAYRQNALTTGDVQGAIDDLSWRVDLLLGPLAAKPHKFRRVYRHLVQLLNKERRESGLSDAEMAEYARRFGKTELKEMTISELRAIKDVSNSPAWKHLEATGVKFQPEQKTHVVIEHYPFWPEIETTTSEEHYLVPDYAFGQRIVYRITLPDGQPLVITITRSRATGLRGKLTEGMIRLNKERASEKASAAS